LTRFISALDSNLIKISVDKYLNYFPFSVDEVLFQCTRSANFGFKSQLAVFALAVVDKVPKISHLNYGKARSSRLALQVGVLL
jgi:hypothetical protein